MLTICIPLLGSLNQPPEFIPKYEITQPTKDELNEVLPQLDSPYDDSISEAISPGGPWFLNYPEKIVDQVNSQELNIDSLTMLRYLNEVRDYIDPNETRFPKAKQYLDSAKAIHFLHKICFVIEGEDEKVKEELCEILRICILFINNGGDIDHLPPPTN